MPLVSVVGDQNNHGHGELITPPQTTFTIGGKLVTTVDTVASGDDATHPTGPTNSSSGSATFTISGKAVHRHNDSRYCGATTIVSGQSTFTLGG